MAIYRGDISINDQRVAIIEEQEQRVLTTEQLATGFGTTVNSIKNNFARNRSRFTEGKHYYVLEGDALKQFKNQVTNSDLVQKNAAKLYLWTERGAARHSKILDTDEAWAMFDVLEKHYFESKQEDKPMDLADQLMLQAKLNIEIRNRLNAQDYRLNQQDQRLDQQAADIKRLQQAHNGMSLRHEMKNNDQQKQIDQNTEDITSLQKSMFELLQEKSDISQDLDIFIKSLVKTYDRYLVLDNKARYQTAWNDFYKAIADEAGKPNSEGYIMALVNRKREEQIKGGVAKTTAYKNVTGKTVVNNYPELRNAAIAIMTRITEDIKNHELDKEQEG